LPYSEVEDSSQLENHQVSRRVTAQLQSQARYQVKRKAYVEQMEKTTTTPQAAVVSTDEQVSTIPSLQVKVEELERDIAQMRQLLAKYDNNTLLLASSHLPIHIGANPEAPAGDHVLKRQNEKPLEGVYISSRKEKRT
ncbi:hypothetical protein CPB84DRAFT_1787933, partial [Gymnopilus junonius]